LKLRREVSAEHRAEAVDEDVILVRRRFERMRKNDFLLGFCDGDFKPVGWAIELRSLKLVPSYLSVFVVPKVRQRAKQVLASSNETFGELCRKILVEAAQRGLTFDGGV
jgi:hypothetical protein